MGAVEEFHFRDAAVRIRGIGGEGDIGRRRERSAVGRGGERYGRRLVGLPDVAGAEAGAAFRDAEIVEQYLFRSQHRVFTAVHAPFGAVVVRAFPPHVEAVICIGKEGSAIAHSFQRNLERAAAAFAAFVFYIRFHPGAFERRQAYFGHRAQPAAAATGAVDDLHFLRGARPGRDGDERRAGIAFDGFDLENVGEPAGRDKACVQFELPAVIGRLALGMLHVGRRAAAALDLHAGAVVVGATVVVFHGVAVKNEYVFAQGVVENLGHVRAEGSVAAVRRFDAEAFRFDELVGVAGTVGLERHL